MTFELISVKYPNTQKERDDFEKQKKRIKRMRQLLKMHSRAGISEGHVCGDCDHLIDIEYNTKTYFKCALYGDSRCEATDWRKKWQACGHFKNAQ